VNRGKEREKKQRGGRSRQRNNQRPCFALDWDLDLLAEPRRVFLPESGVRDLGFSEEVW
jgi:hypothetical protein